MPYFLPRAVPEESWKPIGPHRAYAVRARSGEDIRLRIGQGIFMVITSSASKERMISGVDFETGELSLLGKIKEDQTVCIGRTSECGIRIMHAIVSRQHTELRLMGEILIVKDMGSTNGTYCHADNVFFDVDAYIERHRDAKPEESTMDEIHEEFGPLLDDFLKKYSELNRG